MHEFTIVREFSYPLDTVWRTMTDPDLVSQWTVVGRGGRPVGFVPEVGTRFQLVGKPLWGWRGIVDCEVLDVDKPNLLRYSWQGEEGGAITNVSIRLESTRSGTRLTFTHTDFSGIGGFFMSHILLTVRTKMLDKGVPPVLASVAEGTSTETS